MEENHNTILKRAARSVLKPEGLFQKGSSRIWVDDNGWFFTVVEFQGSWCDKGSYLNVGMQHLWNPWESLLTICGVRSTREPEWAEYNGDGELFAEKITEMAQLALERVQEYRSLRNLETAKKAPLMTTGIAPTWAAWNQFMTAALAGDIPRSRKLSKKVRGSFRSFPIDSLEEELNQVLPLLDEPSKLHAYIVDRIASQRAYWRSKPGLKRLAVHPEFF